MKQLNYQILDVSHFKAQYAGESGFYSPFELGIPLLDISDAVIEEIYYFRWHTYSKHIKKTPEGHVVTEFLPPVSWAGKYNTICCPAGHHMYEGRWIHNQEFLADYARFWFSDGAAPRLYSFWSANAVWAICLITGNFSLAENLYEPLKENYAAWEAEKLISNGLFYQIDDRDGMEYSAGGSGCRPTINSYMFADAIALSKIATRLGKADEATIYAEKAKSIQEKVESLLWDESASFYKTLVAARDYETYSPWEETATFSKAVAETQHYEKANVRELIGYVPWYFHLPAEDKALAWKYLNDKQYFDAPYGPTTTEQNHPDFMKEFDHECLWNGPSWPFATSQTLTALGNLLADYKQDIMHRSDYYRLLHQYAQCHYLTENGKTVPFIDENLDPFTGEWLARKILQARTDPNQITERGKDYNHSTFCDLVLNGLAGIRAREDAVLEIVPLFSETDLSYFCADGIFYHGHSVCVLWDSTGERYQKGKGFRVYCDGKEVYTPKNDAAQIPSRISIPL